MHRAEIATCLCSWHNALQWHLLRRNKPALGTPSLPPWPPPPSRTQRFVTVPRGKCWHCGLLLFLVSAAHISKLSGASWWWRGEIGLTAFWRAFPPCCTLAWNMREWLLVTRPSPIVLGETIAINQRQQFQWLVFLLFEEVSSYFFL